MICITVGRAAGSARIAARRSARAAQGSVGACVRGERLGADRGTGSASFLVLRLLAFAALLHMREGATGIYVPVAALVQLVKEVVGDGLNPGALGRGVGAVAVNDLVVRDGV